MSIVFDASALLVLLNQEPGHEQVEKYLSQAVMSAVNLAEAITVLVSIGVPQPNAVTMTTHLMADIIPFDTEQAAASAALRQATKPFGLSLGDRACLALAQHRKLPVLTADRVWEKLTLPIDIQLVR